MWSSSSDAEQRRRLRQRPRDVDVVRARRRVTRRVVVDDDEVGDGLDDRRAQHLGEPDDRRVAVAEVDHPLADDTVAAVEQQHAQLLLRERRHLRPQQALHVLGRADDRSVRFAVGPRLDLVAHRQLAQDVEVAAKRREQRVRVPGGGHALTSTGSACPSGQMQSWWSGEASSSQSRQLPQLRQATRWWGGVAGVTPGDGVLPAAVQLAVVAVVVPRRGGVLLAVAAVRAPAHDGVTAAGTVAAVVAAALELGPHDLAGGGVAAGSAGLGDVVPGPLRPEVGPVVGAVGPAVAGAVAVEVVGTLEQGHDQRVRAPGRERVAFGSARHVRFSFLQCLETRAGPPPGGSGPVCARARRAASVYRWGG